MMEHTQNGVVHLGPLLGVRVILSLRLFFAVGCCLLSGTSASGQEVFLAIASSTTAVNGQAAIPIAMLLPPVNSTPPAAIQWTLTYNPAQITAVSIQTGDALTSAGKTLTCSSSAGAYTCIAAGENSTTIQTGIIGLISVTLAGGVSSATMGLSGALGADPNANLVSMLTAGGTIVAPTSIKLSSAVCAAASAALANCTVSLTGAAPPGGALVHLAANPRIHVPASVTVVAGSTSATFTVATESRLQNPTVDQQGVTAAYNGASLTAPVSFHSEPALSSISCRPLIVSANQQAACSVTLSSPASFATVVSLSSTSSSVVMPSQVTISPNSAAAIFNVSAQPTTTATSSMLTASFNNSNLGVTMNVVPQSSITSLACDPSSKPGAKVRCNIGLGAISPPEGTEVRISSSSASIQLPPTIRIRAGHREASFEGMISASAGAESAPITVEDKAGAATAKVQIEARTPVLMGPEEVWANAGNPVQLTITAIDPSNLPVTLSAASLPDHATFDPASGMVQWIPAGSQFGNHTVKISVTNSAGMSASGLFRIHVAGGKPTVKRLVNAASRSGTSVCSSGSIASIEGDFSAKEAALMEVRVNDKIAPLVGSTPERADFVCPSGNPGAPLSVTLANSEGESASVKTSLLSAAPGIFSIDNTGAGQGAIHYSDETTLAALPTARFPSASPAQPGDNLTLYATGIDPSLGQLPMVHIGELSAQATSATPVQDRPGVFQVKFQVPEGLARTASLPLYLDVTGTGGDRISSNIVTIAIDQMDR